MAEGLIAMASLQHDVGKIGMRVGMVGVRE